MKVHRATLHDGTIVAMKIQYPGVAQSIESDLLNLKRLVTMTNILPPGLFIDQIMKVASITNHCTTLLLLLLLLFRYRISLGMRL